MPLKDQSPGVYTPTYKKPFMHVRIDPNTHDAAGEPEFFAGGHDG